MPLSLEVVGSNVRDFCMLERNFLSYIKLVLLLMLLLSSALLGIRLPGPEGSEATLGKASLPTAVIQLLAALATIAAAVWEYHNGVNGLLRVRAFIAVTRAQFLLMALVTVMIVAISVIYLVYTA
ncbi:hypothetical protein EV363DRAFT_1578802 [Boletus edulis]|nr:hypothetical protein EV363DRAFT_1578802 [Boletus edulis]